MRTLYIQAKCSDCCVIELRDAKTNGVFSKEKQGYVPRNIGIGGGDYIKLTIDLDNGNIVGWNSPENEDIINAMKDM